jgi:hypothetical protein
MPQHCTKEEFSAVLKDKHKIFALSDETCEGAMFYGNMIQFKDCFFFNTDYESICDFAEAHKCFVEIIKGP